MGVKAGGNTTYEPLFMGTLIISQNAEVLASEAIMGRIVHVKFFKDQLSKASLYASRNLSKYEPENVSQFILQCLSKEKDILEAFNIGYEKYDAMLHGNNMTFKALVLFITMHSLCLYLMRCAVM